MHVVLVTTSYPESQSGSEAAGGFVADFAQQLARHAKVTVVAATSGSASIETEGALKVHRFSVNRWPLSLLSPFKPGDWWPIVKTLRDGRRTLDAVVSNERPDYVLALWALPSGYWAKTMLRRYGVPYGVWALGSDIWSLGRIPVLRSYLGRVLAAADRRFADGLHLAEEVRSLCGLPCDFLPSARRLEVREPRDPAEAPPYRLAYLGRWHPNKGVDLFIRALRQLSSDDWTRVSQVRIYGGGPLEGEVHRMVEQLRSLGYPVDVGGYLDRTGATELITWSDYLVLPSRVESIPVIFSDAAQLRRPLIATPVGDLPRLFGQYEFGVLAAAATADAIAEAIGRALRTPASQFRAQLDAASRQFDVASAAQRFARHVEELEPRTTGTSMKDARKDSAK